jgi:hypothetical protein
LRCWLDYIDTVFTVGGKYSMEPSHVHSGLWYQGGQLGNEIQRLEADMGSAIAVGRFKLVAITA